MLSALPTALFCASAEPVEKRYDFRADDVPADFVARGVGEFFGLSVLLDQGLAKKHVTATLHQATIRESLDAIGFLVGSSWHQNGNVVFYGDAEKERYYAIPSKGANVVAVKLLFPGAQLVGDDVLLKAKPTEFQQLSDVFDKLGHRESSVLRILAADVSTTYTDPVNNFLHSLQAGIDITGSNILHGSPVTAPADIELVWNFLRTKTNARIKTHTAQTVLSGEAYYLAAGDVLQQQIYVRPEQSAATELVSQYVTTQLGLTIKLNPFFSEGTWVVQYDVKDDEVDASNNQNNTEASGSVELRDKRPVLLASLNRAQRTTTDSTMPALSRIPVIGAAFHSHETDKTGRVLYVFLQLGNGN
jgi:hypothetical protein